MPEIGLLNEKPLHASLKEWYAEPGDRCEFVVDGFVIDIVRDDLLVEIQTGGLASIKPKLTRLVDSHRVRLIYPIAQEKWIVRLGESGSNEMTRRKSPKRGRPEDLFWQMVSFPQLMKNPNFSVEVLMIREEELRRYDPKRNWRRRGWGVEERRLLEVLENRVYEKPGDWLVFVPRDLEEFTAGDLADAIGIRRRLAQKIAYCLRNVSLITRIGKRERANLYRVCGS